MAQCPCILCFPDTRVKQRQFCLNQGWGVLDLASERFLDLTIVTFIQRSQRGLHYLSHRADLWSSLSRRRAESLLPLQCPSPGCLRNKRVFKNFIYSLWFQRLASKILQSSLFCFPTVRWFFSFSFLPALSGVCFSSWFIYYPSLCN